jgi:prepilin-type N-terminal cleavage/methylation domain-containing protein
MVMNNRAFTLTELLIVLAIITFLTMISVPAYIGQQRSATRHEAFSNLENLRLLEEQFFAENGEYTPAGGGTIIYNASPNTADNGIEDALRGYRPGGCLTDDADPTPCASPFGLNFTYSVTSADTNADNLADTFIASATPVPGSRVSNDPVYTIDQNNVRNW